MNLNFSGRIFLHLKFHYITLLWDPQYFCYG
jgi:hypothetical protein